MCTVTIIPQGKDNFIITSNRDEFPNRISLPPEIYKIEDVEMLFPKDVLSDGSWIGVSEKNRLLCLLNGGFEKHERQDRYRLSRGILVKELLSCDGILDVIKSYNLKEIEPFTLVIADWNKSLQLFELVWDGIQKHLKKLPFKPTLWSSSTLYNSRMRQERQDWFKGFKQNKNFNSESLLDFHKTAGASNMDYGVIMDRGFVKTTSITQVEKSQGALTMRYIDLKNNQTHEKGFNSVNTSDE